LSLLIGTVALFERTRYLPYGRGGVVDDILFSCRGMEDDAAVLSYHDGVFLKKMGERQTTHRVPIVFA
jgi:hypothetical protein